MVCKSLAGHVTSSLTNDEATHHFEDVSDLGHVVDGQVGQQRHAAQEVDVVVDTLQSRLLHHLLEDATVQHPHLGRRHRCHLNTNEISFIHLSTSSECVQILKLKIFKQIFVNQNELTYEAKTRD